jgi:hypothetical protein
MEFGNYSFMNKSALNELKLSASVGPDSPPGGILTHPGIAQSLRQPSLCMFTAVLLSMFTFFIRLWTVASL